MSEFINMDIYNLLLLATGIIALLAATVPVMMERKLVTAPILYLILGIAFFFFFSKSEAEPLKHMEPIKRITEFVVIVALTNAGLKIKRPFKWSTWKYSVRLLAIAMPVTIVAAAYLGWWIMGLAPATAILFGALISPTDPVLASHLQTSQPSEDDTSTIKLGLTSEAGMNDGLAFPFTYFAIMAASEGLDYKEWIGEWFLHYFLLKIAIALIIGAVSGWLLYKTVFSIGSHDQLSKISRGILSLSLTLLPYAITEVLGGYGFIAVFIAACMFSKYEKDVEHMDNLHDFNEELEAFIVAFLFIMIGIFFAFNYEKLFEPQIIAVALIMVLVVRPIAGYLSLIKTNLKPFQRFVMSFYGIRGIGSVFYLAYAFTSATFEDPTDLIGVMMVTIFLSVIIHGISSHWVQKKIERYNDTEAAQNKND
jgi:NhaP-type Na+/H+ or K+/H+ antiporter